MSSKYNVTNILPLPKMNGMNLNIIVLLIFLVSNANDINIKNNPVNPVIISHTVFI